MPTNTSTMKAEAVNGLRNLSLGLIEEAMVLTPAGKAAKLTGIQKLALNRVWPEADPLEGVKAEIDRLSSEIDQVRSRVGDLERKLDQAMAAQWQALMDHLDRKALEDVEATWHDTLVHLRNWRQLENQREDERDFDDVMTEMVTLDRHAEAIYGTVTTLTRIDTTEANVHLLLARTIFGLTFYFSIRREQLLLLDTHGRDADGERQHFLDYYNIRKEQLAAKCAWAIERLRERQEAMVVHRLAKIGSLDVQESDGFSSLDAFLAGQDAQRAAEAYGMNPPPGFGAQLAETMTTDYNYHLTDRGVGGTEALDTMRSIGSRVVDDGLPGGSPSLPPAAYVASDSQVRFSWKAVSIGGMQPASRAPELAQVRADYVAEQERRLRADLEVRIGLFEHNIDSMVAQLEFGRRTLQIDEVHALPKAGTRGRLINQQNEFYITIDGERLWPPAGEQISMTAGQRRDVALTLALDSDREMSLWAEPGKLLASTTFASSRTVSQGVLQIDHPLTGHPVNIYYMVG